jgi:hypothetical protein
MNKSIPTPGIPNNLSEVFNLSTQYASSCMCAEGAVVPTCIIVNDRTILLYREPDVCTDGSDEIKEYFTTVASLLAVVQKARFVAVIVEAWIGLEEVVRSSEDPNRRECVFINAESHAKKGSKALAIKRDAAGIFFGLTPFFATIGMPEMDAEEIEAKGNFSGLMPVKPSTARDREEAKRQLAALGVDPSQYIGHKMV